MTKYRELDIEDYLLILKRRKWWPILLSLSLGLAAFGFSFLIANEYLSETLILVQEQRVPTEYVRSTITAGLQDRLQTMTQEILSRTRLQRIIEKFGLYRSYSERKLTSRLAVHAGAILEKVGVDWPGEPRGNSEDPALEDLIATMRTHIKIELVRSPGPSIDVTAFRVTYIGEAPHLAQQVTSELTSMFIQENLKVREQMSEDTSRFIEIELETARKELNEQEAKLKEFKSRYMGQLPEQERANLLLLSQAQFQLQTNEESLNRLRQEEILLKNSLSQFESMLRIQAGGEVAAESPLSLQRQLSELRARLNQMKTRYTSEHPDMIKLMQEIAQLQTNLEQAAQAPDEKTPESSRAVPPDPEIAHIRSQLEVNQLAQQGRLKGRERIEQSINLYQARIRLTPLREQQYLELTRDYGSAKSSYESLLNKKKLSRMARNLERSQQGEQFRILDPANLPTTPYRPNRPLISLGGALAGLLLGLGLVTVLALLDKSLRNQRDVEFYLETPVLALIPLISTTAGKQRFSLRLSRQSRAAARVSVT